VRRLGQGALVMLAGALVAGGVVAGCGQGRTAEEPSTSAGAESTGSVSDDYPSERV